MKRMILMTLLVFSTLGYATTPKKVPFNNPKVKVMTNYGELEVELFQREAPLTVKNFLRYVEEKKYDGTIFHRVVRNFVLQGGGFDEKMKKVETHAPIKNEAHNGLLNTRGTLSMARTPDLHSATNQFFINLKDNDFLNHRDKTQAGYGYAVFGKVTKGMTTVNRIQTVKVTNKMGHQNVPSDPVKILSVRIVK